MRGLKTARSNPTFCVDWSGQARPSGSTGRVRPDPQTWLQVLIIRILSPIMIPPAAAPQCRTTILDYQRCQGWCSQPLARPDEVRRSFYDPSSQKKPSVFPETILTRKCGTNGFNSGIILLYPARP